MMTKLNNTKKEKTDHPVDTHSRRSFLSILWTVLGLAAVAEFIAVFIAFLTRGKSVKKDEKAEKILELGHVDNFTTNSVTANIQGKFYLCRMKDGGFLALSSKCTHLGCTVPWKEKENKFTCPCHGSTFDITGSVITSPAPRPLDIYPLNIENNIIRVDTGKIIRRDKFLKEQLVYMKKGQI